MGRLLQSSICVQGELIAATPVHSGCLRENVFSDLPLAVDGEGTVYFPGTAIAGPLRAWWYQVDPDLADSVWGRVEAEPGSNGGWASILIVHDAHLVSTTDLDLAQHVNISSKTGTAAGTLKFDRELVPVNARFGFSIELQRPLNHYGPTKKLDCGRWRDIQAVLRGMLEDLAEGAIRFGADKSRGRGVLRLDLGTVQISCRDLAGGILESLAGKAQPEGIHDFFRDETGGSEVASVRLHKQEIGLKLECQPVAPIMQRHEAEGAAADIMPAIAIEGDERKPFLSGTGIKGAFRAQSERIFRTALGHDTDEADSLDLVNALYGAKAEKTERARAAPKRDDPRYYQPGQGAVNFDDYRFDHPLSLNKWNELLTLAADKSQERLVELGKATKDTGWGKFTAATMVAIDRWTGGAADGFLYTRLEPEKGKMTLSATIDVERIAPPPRFWRPSDDQSMALRKSTKNADRNLDDERRLACFRHAALALFLLTLRDFARGRIPLGYGVNRGLGDLDLETATFTGWPCPIPSEITLRANDFDDARKMSVFDPLQVAWTAYQQQNCIAPGRCREGESSSDA